jgi:mRNA interferase MazF
MITSSHYADPGAVALSDADFAIGSLQRESFARPTKLFTTDVGLIVRVVGTLKAESHARVVNAIVAMLQA